MKLFASYWTQLSLGPWHTPFNNWKPVTQLGQVIWLGIGQLANRQAYETKVKPGEQRLHM